MSFRLTLLSALIGAYLTLGHAQFAVADSNWNVPVKVERAKIKTFGVDLKAAKQSNSGIWSHYRKIDKGFNQLLAAKTEAEELRIVKTIAANIGKFKATLNNADNSLVTAHESAIAMLDNAKTVEAVETSFSSLTKDELSFLSDLQHRANDANAGGSNIYKNRVRNLIDQWRQLQINTVSRIPNNPSFTTRSDIAKRIRAIEDQRYVIRGLNVVSSLMMNVLEARANSASLGGPMDMEGFSAIDDIKGLGTAEKAQKWLEKSSANPSLPSKKRGYVSAYDS